MFYKFRLAFSTFFNVLKSDSLVAKEIVSHFQMSNDQIKIRIADQCLATQISLASKVASTINTRVYIYDPTCYFSTPPYDTVLYDNVRTIRKEGHTALLSTAAQSVVTSNTEYRSLIPPTRISEDSIGVYIKP